MSSINASCKPKLTKLAKIINVFGDVSIGMVISLIFYRGEYGVCTEFFKLDDN
jgi:hypothetical protein